MLFGTDPKYGNTNYAYGMSVPSRLKTAAGGA